MAAEDTRLRIVEAAVATIKREGITGTSARAIARTGGFNQALIFYHFGSIDEVLMAAIEHTSRQRIARYRERLADVTTLPDLARVATDLHAEDMEEGNLTVLTQLMAGAAGHEVLGPRLREAFDPWIEIVVESLRTAIGGSPYEKLVPLEDMGYAVSALFLGIELLTHLDPTRSRDETLFETINLLAGVVQSLIETSDAEVPLPDGRERIRLNVE
jgi:AcrR family transcriptional regulator